MDKFLIIVCGPTAAGKTDTAISLATHHQCEIISADSRQFYKELNIGTAKPDKHQLVAVRHHFINNLSITDEYNAGSYARDCQQLMHALFKEYDLIIMVGGSGLYIDAAIHGFDDIPDVPKDVRTKWNKILEEKGIGYLRNRLKVLDQQYYDQVDLSNPQRLIRALEVIDHTGNQYSNYRKKRQIDYGYHTLKIGVELPRSELYRRIDKRMDNMIEDGLFDEARSLYKYRGHNALQTVGYKEIFDYLNGFYDYDEAVRLLKRNTRRYAKRQLTWFKRDKEVVWFHPEAIASMKKYIELKLSNT
ncbi:MAG TPA: tRNA (adenosine(37)-N6)-dimethylallyltransferase MiaA [Cyclobacteriaceae bacterium]